MSEEYPEKKPAGFSAETGGRSEDETVAAVEDGTVINASGYKDQLKRQYGLLGLAGIALTVDNAWIALGSSISVSIGMSISRYLVYPCRRGRYRGLVLTSDPNDS